MRVRKNKGFTLIELVVTIAIIAILATIITPIVVGLIEHAKITVDHATVRTLNSTTSLYRFDRSNDPFNDSSNTSVQLMGFLVDEGFLAGPVQPQMEDSSFNWSVDIQRWIYVSSSSNDSVPIYLLTSSDFQIGSGPHVLKDYTNTDQKNIQIPEGITTIQGGLDTAAFFQKDIDSVILPNSLKRLNSHAFYGNNLKEIVIPPNVTNINTYSFYDNPITKITILADPSQVKIQNRAFGTGYNESRVVTDNFRTAFINGGPGTYELVNGIWVKTD